MATAKAAPDIDELIREEKWAEAERAIVTELESDSDNHWLLTQLAVTYYERGRYSDALRELVRSSALVSDCPLTAWNIAGTLAALERPRDALDFYLWIIDSEKSPEDDPCWESEEWTRALKTDAVYRAAGCFEQLKQFETAERLYSLYLQLLARGHKGMYSKSDTRAKVQELRERIEARPRTRFKGLVEALSDERPQRPLPVLGTNRALSFLSLLAEN